MSELVSFNSCGVAVYPPGAVFGPRRLLDYEFVWIIDGDVEWHTEGTSVQLGPGQVALGRPGMVDSFRWDTRKRTRHGYIHFSLPTPTHLPPMASWPLVRLADESAILIPLFTHLGWLFGHHPDGWKTQAEQALRLALDTYVRGTGHCVAIEDTEMHPTLARIFAHVLQRWSGGTLYSISLAELCRVSRVSPIQLSRLFRTETGFSPITALRLLRLERAAQSLVATELSIDTIARQCGFADLFHFSRTFRSQYGMPPTVYRRHLRLGNPQPVLPLARIRRLWSHVWLPAEASVNRPLAETI